MTTDETSRETNLPEGPEAELTEEELLEAELLGQGVSTEPDDGSDPETVAHEDPDPETIAHVADADEEALAGRLQEGRLEGSEDGRLLD